MPLRAIENLRAGQRGIGGARNRDVLVGNEQRAEPAAEVLDAVAQQLLQRARVLAFVLVDGQEQVEPRIVARRRGEHRALEVHAVLEAVEHGTQEPREHGAAVAAALARIELDHERSERRAVLASQTSHERRHAIARVFDAAPARDRIGGSQLVEQLA